MFFWPQNRMATIAIVENAVDSGLNNFILCHCDVFVACGGSCNTCPLNGVGKCDPGQCMSGYTLVGTACVRKFIIFLSLTAHYPQRFLTLKSRCKRFLWRRGKSDSISMFKHSFTENLSICCKFNNWTKAADKGECYVRLKLLEIA